jgi:uncharacterized protein YkuJ
MRRLAELHERYGQDTPEREFYLAAGDAGAKVDYDNAKKVFTLTFNDKNEAYGFKKEYLDYEGVSVIWRERRDGTGIYVIEVDKETALQAFTPDPDALARESVLGRLARSLSEEDSDNWPEAMSDGYDVAKKVYSYAEVPDDKQEIRDAAEAEYERIGGQRKRGYKRSDYVKGFLVSTEEIIRARAHVKRYSTHESAIDERTMTPAMQRTLDKVAAELASRVGEKVAKEMIQKYVAAGDEKGKAT